MSSWSKQSLHSLEGRAKGPTSRDLWSICWNQVELLSVRYGLLRYLAWPLDQSLEDESAAWRALQEGLERAAYQLCLERLARLARSRQQLGLILKRMQLPEAWIERVLDKIAQSGYIDEGSMKTRLVQRLKRQGKSRRQVEIALMAKGLASDYNSSEEEELQKALAHLEKWARRDNLLENPTRYLQRLAQRGFESSIVYQAYELWKKSAGENAQKTK